MPRIQQQLPQGSTDRRQVLIRVDEVPLESCGSHLDQRPRVVLLVQVLVPWVWREDGRDPVERHFRDRVRAGPGHREFRRPPGKSHLVDELQHHRIDPRGSVGVLEGGPIGRSAQVEDLPPLQCAWALGHEANHQLVERGGTLGGPGDQEGGFLGGEPEPLTTGCRIRRCDGGPPDREVHLPREVGEDLPRPERQRRVDPLRSPGHPPVGSAGDHVKVEQEGRDAEGAGRPDDRGAHEATQCEHHAGLVAPQHLGGLARAAGEATDEPDQPDRPDREGGGPDGRERGAGGLQHEPVDGPVRTGEMHRGLRRERVEALRHRQSGAEVSARPPTGEDDGRGHWPTVPARGPDRFPGVLGARPGPQRGREGPVDRDQQAEEERGQDPARPASADQGQGDSLRGDQGGGDQEAEQGLAPDREEDPETEEAQEAIGVLPAIAIPGASRRGAGQDGDRTRSGRRRRRSQARPEQPEFLADDREDEVGGVGDEVELLFACPESPAEEAPAGDRPQGLDDVPARTFGIGIGVEEGDEPLDAVGFGQHAGGQAEQSKGRKEQQVHESAPAATRTRRATRRRECGAQVLDGDGTPTSPTRRSMGRRTFQNLRVHAGPLAHQASRTGNVHLMSSWPGPTPNSSTSGSRRSSIGRPRGPRRRAE